MIENVRMGLGEMARSLRTTVGLASVANACVFNLYTTRVLTVE